MADSAEYNPLSGANSGSKNFQEYFLQGSVVDSSVDKLLQRLHGLCENIPRVRYTENEQTFVLKTSAGTGTVTVKVSQNISRQDMPWQMKYIGGIEIGKNAPSRSIVTVAVSEDPSRFLEDLGFQKMYGFTSQGHLFRKNNIKITVSKIQKLLNEYLSDSHLVEISIAAQAGQDSVAEEIRQFSELLKPIITFDVDHRRVQMKP